MLNLEWNLNLLEKGRDGIWGKSELTLTCRGSDDQISEIRDTINNKILQMRLQEEEADKTKLGQ